MTDWPGCKGAVVVTEVRVALGSVARVTLRLLMGLVPTFLRVIEKATLPLESLTRFTVWTLTWGVALRVLAVLKKML